MANIDVSWLKTELSALAKHRKHPDPRGEGHSERELASRRTHARSLEQFFTKAGIDVAELNKILAKDQSELRRTLDRPRTEDRLRNEKAPSPSAKDTLHHAIAKRRKTLEHFANRSTKPSTPSIIILDKPFLIDSSFANLDQFKESHIESLNSFIRFDNVVSPGGTALNAQGRFATYNDFHFFFMWENESDQNAFVNVASSFIFNGPCDVWAARGFPTGDYVRLSLSASLDLFEWWNQPPTTPLSQATQMQAVADIRALGDWFLGNPVNHDGKYFSLTPIELGYSIFLVPPKGIAIFNMNVISQLEIDPFEGGGEIGSSASAEFSNVDLDHKVLCPFVQLEIL